MAEAQLQLLFSPSSDDKRPQVKDWRDEVGTRCRDHSIQRLLQLIPPFQASTPEEVVAHPQMKFAQAIESRIFQSATCKVRYIEIFEEKLASLRVQYLPLMKEQYSQYSASQTSTSQTSTSQTSTSQTSTSEASTGRTNSLFSLCQPSTSRGSTRRPYTSEHTPSASGLSLRESSPSKPSSSTSTSRSSPTRSSSNTPILMESFPTMPSTSRPFPTMPSTSRSFPTMPSTSGSFPNRWSYSALYHPQCIISTNEPSSQTFSSKPPPIIPSSRGQSGPSIGGPSSRAFSNSSSSTEPSRQFSDMVSQGKSCAVRHSESKPSTVALPANETSTRGPFISAASASGPYPSQSPTNRPTWNRPTVNSFFPTQSNSTELSNSYEPFTNTPSLYGATYQNYASGSCEGVSGPGNYGSGYVVPAAVNTPSVNQPLPASTSDHSIPACYTPQTSSALPKAVFGVDFKSGTDLAGSQHQCTSSTTATQSAYSNLPCNEPLFATPPVTGVTAASSTEIDYNINTPASVSSQSSSAVSTAGLAASIKSKRKSTQLSEVPVRRKIAKKVESFTDNSSHNAASVEYDETALFGIHASKNGSKPGGSTIYKKQHSIFGMSFDPIEAEASQLWQQSISASDRRKTICKSGSLLKMHQLARRSEYQCFLKATSEVEYGRLLSSKLEREFQHLYQRSLNRTFATAHEKSLSPPTPPSDCTSTKTATTSVTPPNECTLCMDNECDTAIYTCGHVCLCHACALIVKSQPNPICPICRQCMKDVIQLYKC